MIRPTPQSTTPPVTTAAKPGQGQNPGQGATPTPKRRGRPPNPNPGPKPQKTTRPGAGLRGSPEAKKKASVVLEVLAGLRSPPSGAAALGVSVQRYYMIEVRALQGLLTALDAKLKPGAPPSPETTLRKVVAERDRLERELLRAQALLRVAQRAVGLQPPEPPSAKQGKAGPGKRKTRAPTVRARRAVDELRKLPPGDGNEAAQLATGTTTASSAPRPTAAL